MGLRGKWHGGGTLAVAGVLVSAAGCGSDADPEPESAQEADTAPETGGDEGGEGGLDGDPNVDIEDDGMSVETGDGTGFSMEASAEVPDVVSDLVPLPDGFVAEATTETTTEDGLGTMVTGKIDTDDPAAVLSGIEAALAAEGFETLANSEIGGEMFTLSTVKEGEAHVTVGIITNDDGEPADMSVTVGHVEG